MDLRREAVRLRDEVQTTLHVPAKIRWGGLGELTVTSTVAPCSPSAGPAVFPSPARSRASSSPHADQAAIEEASMTRVWTVTIWLAAAALTVLAAAPIVSPQAKPSVKIG